MKNEAILAAVFPDSIASEIGLVPGDRLLAVNGQKMKDIIDTFQYILPMVYYDKKC